MIIFGFCMSCKTRQQKRGKCALFGRTGGEADETRLYNT